MTATAQNQEIVVNVPIEKLFRSPTDPRHHGGEPDAEFVESIKRGILQPPVVRPWPKPAPKHWSLKDAKPREGYEVVFGNRRRRGAELAGHTTVPVIVRLMTDDEVLDAQAVENDQRKDVHPLDQADHYAVMVDRGHSIEHIAAKIGRPTRFVRERLELGKLHPKAREALDEDKISLGHALLLCRIPEKLQPDALKGMSATRDEVAMSVSAAGEMVRDRFMLKLVDAPFDRSDADLVPKAGPCTVCPKRTGNQGELFSDVKSPDVCTDPVCYRSKLDARWNEIKKAAQAGGQEIVPKGQVKFWERSNSLQSDKWTSYDGDHYLGYSPGGGGGHVKIKTLLGKDVKPALVQNPHTGTIVEVVSRAAIEKAARAYKTKKTKAKGGAKREKVSASEKTRRERQKLEGQSRERIKDAMLAAVVQRCELITNGNPTSSTILLLREAVRFCVSGVYGAELAIFGRRSGAAKDETTGNMNRAEKALDKMVDGAKTLGAVFGLLFEALLFERLDYPAQEDQRRIDALCKLLRVDRAKVKAAAIAEHKAETDRAKAAAKTEKPKKKARRK